MAKYIYRFVAGDFDMREQTFTRTFDEEKSEEQIQEMIDATLALNKPHIAYCECYEREVVPA